MSQLRLRPAPIGANVYPGGDNASSLRVNGREQRQKAALLTERQTNSRGETRVFWRLLTMQARLAGPALLAALLGCVLVASNLGLLSVAVYLIAASAVVSLLALLTIPIFFVRLMGLVRPLARYGERCVSHDLTFRLLARLRSRIYASLEPLAPALLLNYRSGDLLTRLLADIDELQHLYLRLLAPLLIACGISLCTFLVLAHFSSLLAWVALAFLLLAAGIVPVLCWRMARGLGTRRLALRAEQKAMFLDGIQGIQDLLACGQALTYLEKLDALDARVSTIQRCLNWIAASQEGLTDFLKQGAVWSLLVLAIPMVAHGRLDGIYPGCLALLVLASFEIAPPLAQVSQFLDHALAAGRRLFALLDAVPVVNEPAQPLPLSQQAISAGCELAFEHLEFSYSRNTDRQECGGVRASEIACSSEGRTEMEWSDAHQSRQQVRERGQLRLDDVDWREVGESGEPVLKDINLRVRAGSRIALVGSSGAGKSTLLRLALRCWDADAGRITLNGLDIRRYALSDVRNLMGVVTQDTHLFHTTLRNNLLIARPQANDDELLRALDLAQLGECVRQLPQGLETRIGEQGTRLSGGERQRLAIARALLKDAPVLLLDEVTANLDLQTEQDVLTALRTLMRGRTVLLVTHRLVGMEHMDEIVVLEHGRIQERGTHAHLLARQGRYAQLWNIQQSVFPVVVASVLDRSGESPGSGTPEVGHPLFSAEEDNEDDGHTMTSTFLHADRRAAVEGSLATAFSGRQPPSEENT